MLNCRIYQVFFILSFVFFSRITSIAQVKSLKKQVVAHYSFEKNLNDVSGYQIHGRSDTTFSYAPGVVGQAISFNGKNYFELPNNLTRLDLREKAISFWLKPGDLKYDFNFVLDKNVNSDYSLLIEKERMVINFGYMVKPGYGNAIAYVKIDPDKWNFIVVNRKLDNFEIFLNGEMEGVLKITKVSTKPNTLLVGGKRPENQGLQQGKKISGNFVGELDELIFYDRPLSEEEVKLMTAYKGEMPQNIQLNEAFQIDNILFERDHYDLKEESHRSLQELIDYLNVHPDRKVRINGHTDNKGSVKHNQELSLNRAKEVKKYLVGQGIRKGRIKTKGFGGTQPLIEGSDPEDLERNRRVEFVIF